MLKSRSYPPDESLQDRKHNYKEIAKQNSLCSKEHDLSLSCLNDNFYVREKCQTYFDNYNKCREFWDTIHQTRKRQGIKPYLPDVEDRESVKQQFLSGGM